MYICFFDSRDFYGNHKKSPYINSQRITEEDIYIDDKYKNEIMNKIHDLQFDNINDFKHILKNLGLEEFII